MNQDNPYLSGQFDEFLEQSIQQVKELSGGSPLYVKCNKDAYKVFYQWGISCSNCLKDHRNKYYTASKFLIPPQYDVIAINVAVFKAAILKKFNEDVDNFQRELNSDEVQAKGSFAAAIPLHFNPEDRMLNQSLNDKRRFFIKFIDDETQKCVPIDQQNQDPKFKVVNIMHLRRKVVNLFQYMLSMKVVQILQQHHIQSGLDLRQNMNMDQLINDEIVTQRQEVERQTRILEALQAEQIKLDGEMSELSIQFEKHGDRSITVQEMLKPVQTDVDFYDCEIKCDSILELTAGNGWQVIFNEQKQANINKAKKVCVVSFYGLYNKGKSFVASKLSKKQLPSGFHVSTVGLSALYPEREDDNQTVYLDTAGTETPISYKNDYEFLKPHQKQSDLYEYKLKDRLLTEHLIQRFILSKSNIVVIVVDQLTKEEQRIIQKIKNLYISKSIIIIHNFSKLTRQQDVEHYITKDIIEAFDVTKHTQILTDDFHPQIEIKGDFFVEANLEDKKQQVIHVVLAFEYSQAGKIYNEFCYRFLKKQVIAQKDQQEFNILKEVVDMLNKYLPEIVDISEDSKEKIQVVAEQEIKENKPDNKQFHRIKCNAKTTELKSVSFDLLGDLRVFKGGLNPRYNHFKVDNYFVLHIEVSGQIKWCQFNSNNEVQEINENVLTCKISNASIYEYHGFTQDDVEQVQVIQVKGYKIDESNVDLGVYCNNREMGQFKVLVKLNSGDTLLSDDKPEFVAEQGILQLKYKLEGANNGEDDDPPIF